MFQFTTTNVINSNFETGYTPTGISTVDEKHALWSVLEATDDKPASLHVKRVNNFLSTNITAVYKAEAVDAELAKVSIDLALLNGQPGDSFRLSIYVGLSLASQESKYANDLILKGKPFSVDFVWDESAATTAEKLVKVINKYEVLVYGERLLKVSDKGTFLTIEAVNEYQRFRKVNIEKFDKEAYHGMGDYSIIRSLEDLPKVDSNAEVTNAVEGFFPGKEGFGTYPFLLHNLRIPTFARTRAFGINQEETPIVGAKYNQYTIHYCVNRGILGNNAVGDLVKSKTTHVFYVRQDLAKDFEAALTLVAPSNEIEVVGPKTDSTDKP